MYDIITIFIEDEYNHLNLSEKIFAAVLITIIYVIIIPIKYIIIIILFIINNYKQDIINNIIIIIKTPFNFIINVLSTYITNSKIIIKEYNSLLYITQIQTKIIEDKNLIIK